MNNKMKIIVTDSIESDSSAPVYIAEVECLEPSGLTSVNDSSAEYPVMNISPVDPLYKAIKQSSSVDSPVTLKLSNIKVEKAPGKDPKAELVRLISRCELINLRLMSAGLTDQDIADKRFKDLETIKTQNSSMFYKLEVHTREDASDLYRRFMIRHPFYPDERN
jgi:DNA-binding NarL/FixJ family response regulator